MENKTEFSIGSQSVCSVITFLITSSMVLWQHSTIPKIIKLVKLHTFDNFKVKVTLAFKVKVNVKVNLKDNYHLFGDDMNC